MFPLLQTDGIPAGAVVVVGMDWPAGIAQPSIGRLREYWPGHDVETFPPDRIQISNAVIGVRQYTTAESIARPARLAGASKVLVFRAGKAPESLKAPDLDPLFDEIKRYARAFAIPGVILREPTIGEPDTWAAPKRLAVMLAIGAGVTGLVLVGLHFAR